MRAGGRGACGPCEADVAGGEADAAGEADATGEADAAGATRGSAAGCSARTRRSTRPRLSSPRSTRPLPHTPRYTRESAGRDARLTYLPNIYLSSRLQSKSSSATSKSIQTT